MLRTLPRLKYSGLTIVLSNPSRFDKVSLLTSLAGHIVNNDCLRPEYNVMQCDIRVADDPSPWLEGTRCVVLLGQYAMHKYCPNTRNNVLNEMRGSPLYAEPGHIPAIASFFPQDAADIKNHEKSLNENSKEFEGHEDNTWEVEDEEDTDVKTFAATKRSNYFFWLCKDFQKCKEILLTGKHPIEPEPIYRIFPEEDEVVETLRGHKDEYMDFDMETDYEQQNMHCFSYSFDDSCVYSVPVLDFNYQPAYRNTGRILGALGYAVSRNIIVAHNGHGFDFPVLGYKYRISIVRAFDTLMAMGRCFPEIEKSLGHVVSLFLHQRFHKDENPDSYRCKDDMLRKLMYCAKDVWTMRLCRQKILEYTKRIPGLLDSIECAMSSIRPYVTISMQGIKYDESLRQKMINENDKLMEQYLRMIELLIGPDGMKEVQSVVKGKAGVFPNSNKQCIKYFHDMLEYPVTQRNPPDKFGVRNPSLSKKGMYKLRLRHDNPVIDLCNMFRAVRLETSTPLGFIPWRDDSGKIIDKNIYEENSFIKL